MLPWTSGITLRLEYFALGGRGSESRRNENNKASDFLTKRSGGIPKRSFRSCAESAMLRSGFAIKVSRGTSMDGTDLIWCGLKKEEEESESRRTNSISRTNSSMNDGLSEWMDG